MLPALPGGARPVGRGHRGSRVLHGGAGEQPWPARTSPGERAATVEQYEKDRDALYERLATRWGPTDPYNLQTVLLRTEREEIPEPWAGLSAAARVAYLWEAEGTGRWVALAVADRDEADEVRLLAVVTQEAPP